MWKNLVLASPFDYQRIRDRCRSMVRWREAKPRILTLSCFRRLCSSFES
uniref:Uncharacterized protein n=1 Tax=Arundo donax TaxID=35708 RepID=A0A0A8YHI5_ARUDO